MVLPLDVGEGGGGSSAAHPSILGQILSRVPAAFTDVDVAAPLCAAAVEALGGACELFRRDRDGVVRVLARAPAEGAESQLAVAVPEPLRGLLAQAHAAAEPVLLEETPWNGAGVAVPVAGLAGVRWLLVLSGLVQPGDLRTNGPLQQLAWAARNALSLGGAVAQLDASRRAADAAAHRLIAVSRLVDLLPASLELEPTVDAILEALVPYVGDWALVYLTQPSGKLERVGGRHTSAEGERTLQQLRQFPLPQEPAVHDQWLSRSEPFRIGAGGPGEAAGWPLAAGEEDLVRALAPISAIVAPMRRGSDLVGALVVGTADSGQRFGRDELRLVRDVAKQARLAIQASQLYAGVERARREREDVLAIVSHDLRNPLQTVRLAGAVLGFPDLAHDKRAQQSAVLERSLDTMDRLIQDLLDAARMEAGRFAVSQRPCAVPGLLADAYRSCELIAAEKQIALRLDPGPSTGMVLADRDAVLRVFGNLLGNAISFTPAGGRITIGADSEAGPGAVTFYVRDTGPGIDPQVLPHIFERYWQANRAARTGAGLGLAIAKGIVEAHGGTIAARTLPEGGSDFRFTLPRSGEGSVDGPASAAI